MRCSRQGRSRKRFGRESTSVSSETPRATPPLLSRGVSPRSRPDVARGIPRRDAGGERVRRRVRRRRIGARVRLWPGSRGGARAPARARRDAASGGADGHGRPDGADADGDVRALGRFRRVDAAAVAGRVVGPDGERGRGLGVRGERGSRGRRRVAPRRRRRGPQAQGVERHEDRERTRPARRPRGGQGVLRRTPPGRRRRPAPVPRRRRRRARLHLPQPPPLLQVHRPAARDQLEGARGVGARRRRPDDRGGGLGRAQRDERQRDPPDEPQRGFSGHRGRDGGLSRAPRAIRGEVATTPTLGRRRRRRQREAPPRRRRNTRA